MINPISKEALLLHAQALEKDTLENADLGRIWLLESLGAAVRATATATGWRPPEASNAEIGEAVWRRLDGMLADTLPANAQGDMVARAVTANSVGNQIDETCIALLFGLGLGSQMTAYAAALRLREATTPNV